MKYKVGAVQIKMKELDLAYNLETLGYYVRQAAKDGARLILLPETCNVGSLCMRREEVLPYAEPIPGKSTDFFSNLCRELEISVAFGMVEHDRNTGLLYNALVLIGRDGEIVGVYRKTHLFSTETNFLAAGNTGIPVFDTEFGKIGLLICEDTVHFETSRLLALQGMDVLLMATCWVDNGPDDAWRTRAAENGVYMVCADWWNTNSEGNAYGGGSCVIDPHGTVLSELAMGDGYVVAEIDTDCVCRDTILSARKKDKYPWLLQDSYLWGCAGQNLPSPAVSQVMALAYGANTIDTYTDELAKHIPAVLEKKAKLVVLPAFLGDITAERFVSLMQGAVADAAEEVLFAASCQGSGGDVSFLFRKKEILLSYQSVHQLPGKTGPDSPDAFCTVDTAVGRIGLMSGPDIFYPEALRCLGRKGADIVCVSGEWDRKYKFMLNERRIFSDCAVLASCRDSQGAYAYFGAPYGWEMTKEEGTLCAELDTGNDSIRNKIDLRKARIDLYEGLLTD